MGNPSGRIQTGIAQSALIVHAALFSLNKHVERLIQMMTIEGPEHDQLRSLLFPQVACNILSSGHPTMNLLLLTPTNCNLNS